MYYCDTREVTFKGEYDVVVVGGGIGGVAAAVAAARNGAKTLLLEKQINLGGLATMGLINWYEPLCDGNGKQVVGGIGEELLHLSIRYGMENLPTQWGGEGRNRCRYDRFATKYSPTVFSLALDAWVKESGATIRFDTMATYPVMENGKVAGIMAETVSGKEFYGSKFVVDATGDASVCVSAGLPTRLGTNYLTYVAHGFTREDTTSKDETVFRRWIMRGATAAGQGHPADQPLLTQYDSDAENAYIAWGKQAMFDHIKDQPKNDRELTSIPTMPQYRKIRCLVGEATFVGEQDSCEDSIGTFGDFRNRGPVFHMPYRCLYNRLVSNLITAGRVVSADGEGWEVARVIPVCALTGQAAGTAAAIALKSQRDFASVDISLLQKNLKEQGVLF
jgi:hypothetical protein